MTMDLSNPLSHAYIITGGDSSAREAHAHRLAMAYVCQGENPPCGLCNHCQKVEKGIHPDVITLSPAEGKREILVDQARALRSDAYIQPNEARRKVYLIQPADSMNEAAQNTLLKVLEEGPTYVSFLLLCAQPGHLLDTVHSRCKTLSLPPREEEVNPELVQLANQLAPLMLDGNEMDLWTFLCALERNKHKTKDLQELFMLTQEALRPFLASRPKECAYLLRLLRRIQEAADFNVGGGHLLGLLCVERGTL